jgi:hypothetical protein
MISKSLQNSLCQGLRACGIRKNDSDHILNTVEKWYNENGPEWTVKRIKDLRQWYETFLAGKPVPPVWFRHDAEDLPLGIWKRVFKLPVAKALGVLSCDTVFYEKTLSDTQKEKFLHGVAGNSSQSEADLLNLIKESEIPRGIMHFCTSRFKVMPKIQFPTIFDMNGSVPIHDGHSVLRPENKLGPALEALSQSWEDVPQVTFDFLDRQNLLGYMPISVLGNEWQLELNRPHCSNVGRISILQQPELKARVVANPNRVTQVTLDPLKEVYMTTARRLKTDVTFRQDAGIAWVQDQLRRGNELAGSDMTSASDLLSVELSLKLVDHIFGFPEIPGYTDYRRYFLEVSRSNWFCKQLGPTELSLVQWAQGDPLGTGPSFGLLTLTNNCAAMLAYELAVNEGLLDPKEVPVKDSFRVVGDDIIMRSEMSDFYNKVIKSLGGEINLSKTLVSDRVAEFAGRVILPNQVFLKRIKYSEPSDNSFMDYMAQLGDQAKHFLRPKQRQVYKLLKEVPGIAVGGHWMPDSYGIPLQERYQWYLEEVEPALRRVETEPEMQDLDMLYLRAILDEAVLGKTIDESQVTPFMDEGYLPSQVTPSFRHGGDPRLTNGKTALDVLYKHVESMDILPFTEWRKREHSRLASNERQFGDQSPIPDWKQMCNQLEELHGDNKPCDIKENLEETQDDLDDEYEIDL